MSDRRRAKLFRNNRSQAVRIPKDMELPGTEVVITRDGDRLIIEPSTRGSLLDLVGDWETLDEPFPEIEDLPPGPIEI